MVGAEKTESSPGTEEVMVFPGGGGEPSGGPSGGRGGPGGGPGGF